MIPCMLQGDEGGYQSLLTAPRDGTNLSIRAQFYNEQQDEGMEKIKTFFNELTKKNNTSLNRISGNSDYLLLTDKPFIDYHKYYKEGGFLYQDFKKHNMTFRTSIRMKDTYVNHGAFSVVKSDDIEKRRKIVIEQITDFLKYHAENYDGAKRLTSAYVQMINFYFDVSDNNFLVSVILDNLLEFLSKILCQDKNQRELIKDERIDKYKKETSLELNLFRDFFSTILNDFSRSNRFWMEGRMLGHQVMGASQKIIFIYSWIARETAEFFRQLGAANGADGDCYFLVTSGGADVTKTRKYFSHHYESDVHLLSLIVPEINLYKHETMFTVLHEIFHWTGIRLRNKRKEFILKSLSQQYAYMLITHLIDENHFAVICDSTCKNNLIKNFAQIIECFIRENMPSINALKNLSRGDNSEFVTSIKKLFSADDLEKFLGLRGEKDIKGGFNSRFLNVCAIEFNDFCMWVLDGNSGEHWEYNPKRLSRTIENYMEPLPEDDTGIIKHIVEVFRALLDRYLGRFKTVTPHFINNPSDHAKKMFDLYTECFVDTCTIVTLNITNFNDYLNIFSHNDDMYKAEPFRIACIIKTHFFEDLNGMANDLKLKSSHHMYKDLDAIKIDLVCAFAKQNIENNNNNSLADVCSEKLREELTEYLLMHEMYKPLEDYLNLCKKTLNFQYKNVTPPFLDWIRNFYNSSTVNKSLDIDMIMNCVHDETKK